MKIMNAASPVTLGVIVRVTMVASWVVYSDDTAILSNATEPVDFLTATRVA